MLVSSPARALDLPLLLGKPLKIDVTEVTIVSQRFDSREVNPISEGGTWGQWINRLNAKVEWNHFTVGVRLDSALYWNTLAQQCSKPTNTIDSGAGPFLCSPGTPTNPNTVYPTYLADDTRRYQNSIYPAKLWAGYKHGAFDVTVGDAYVQFARGLVLSMRKLDDLGIDNTVRGVKASVTKGPFAMTFVAGMANPSRIDEASGQALFVTKRVTDQASPIYNPRLEQPTFGADQIFGAELQAGREKPVVLTTSMSYINRCAPYNYTTGAAAGRITTSNAGTALFGACDNADVTTWLGPLSAPGADRTARHVATIAQAIELPKMGKLGSFYIVGALQSRDGAGPDSSLVSDYGTGTALYATYTGSVKNVTNTVEFKDYRNFYASTASLNGKDLSAFQFVAWSAVPTIESITQDNMLGNFNVCVTGARVRTDVRLNKEVLVYGQGIGTNSRGEQNTTCDTGGTITQPPAARDGLTDWVVDGVAGFQWEFEKKRSHLYASLGGRQDWLGTGQTFLYQGELIYNFSKYISKTVAIEFLGRHRVRQEFGHNVGPDGLAEAWVEGENYTGLSIAPKWVITQGIEYSTFELPANTKFAFIDKYPSWLYLSVGGTYKFTKDSNIRLFVGQQRGGLKCISGVCRVFPAYEGARLELTLRF